MPQVIGGLLLIVLGLLFIVFVILPLVAIILLVGFIVGCAQALGAWCANFWRQCISNPVSTPDVTPT